jgi:serine/threonine-protein kinase
MRDLVGQRLGDYLILDPVGDGGVAAVYRAKSADGSLLALKILKAEALNTEQLYERFLYEAEAQTQLLHPNIVRVLDTGKHDGLPYMIMQLAPGGNLEQYIETRSLTRKDISHIITQLASALDYAHERGIIHRDLKLENMLLDEKGNVLLSDFGMAKDILSVEASVHTEVGTVLGTPLYLSPEQCMNQAVDRRSDVYALGIGLFRILTGSFPFSSPFPHALVAMHLKREPPLVTDFKPSLPQAVNGVIQKALAKSPDDRYQTVGEMAKALQAALNIPVESASEPIAVEASTQAENPIEAARSPREMPPALILAVIVVAIIVIAVGFVLILS